MSFRNLIASGMLLPLIGMAQAADPAAGKAYFAQICTQCHSAEITDGGGEQGPTLFKLFGQPAASSDAAFPYTAALKGSKLVWDAQTLERFLSDPEKAVPGTAMATPVPVKQDRDDLIAYFQSLAGKAK